VKDNNVDACASLVVLTFPEFEVVYAAFEMIELQLPYIPGFLAFREVSFLQKLIEELKKAKPDLFPQLIMVDGNGLLHPRGFGLACHLGVLCGVPTIGIGKTFFCVDGITIEQEKALEKTLKAGETAELIGESKAVWGAILRCTETSVKPVFISIGHKISLQSAIYLVKLSCLYRIPEPVRQADQLSREYIRKHPTPEKQ